MQQQNFKQYGFTLMELLLVLLLISGILFASQAIYKRYALKKDIAVVRQNVELLFNILDRSYFALSKDDQKICASKINTNNITTNDWPLILPSLLTAQIGTPAHPDFIISCVNPTTYAPAQLIIKAPLNVSIDQLDWYAVRLGGVRDGNYVKWQKIPTFIYAGKDPLWILSGQLEKFTRQATFTSKYLIMQLSKLPIPTSLTNSASAQIKYYYTTDTGETKIYSLSTDNMFTVGGTPSLQVDIPKETRTINITKVTIESKGKILATLNPVNDVPLIRDRVTLTIIFNSFGTSIFPYFYANSHQFGTFTPSTFLASDTY